MARPNKIESPELIFELPLKKNADGKYIPFPNHIGGKNELRKLHAKKYNEAYMYLINIIGSDKYKIGVSSNPHRRLRDISSMIPFDLELLALNKIVGAYKLEQELIDKYNSMLIKNEWFQFDKNTVKEIMITLHNKQVQYERRKKEEDK